MNRTQSKRCREIGCGLADAERLDCAGFSPAFLAGKQAAQPLLPPLLLPDGAVFWGNK